MYSEQNIGKKVAKGFGFLMLFILFIILSGLVVMSLWNWLMPALFGFKTLTFLQALGLLLLSKILFGNFGGKHKSGHKNKWKNRMRSKWENMSEEDKERFKMKYESHWCGSKMSHQPESTDQDSIEA